MHKMNYLYGSKNIPLYQNLECHFIFYIKMTQKGKFP